jgi:hypothetical protein
MIKDHLRRAEIGIVRDGLEEIETARIEFGLSVNLQQSVLSRYST